MTVLTDRVDPLQEVDDTDGLISKRFWFVHESGKKLYPYKPKDRRTGRLAFRVAPGGKGANKNENQTYLDDAEEVYRQVFGHGWSVRMRSEDRSVEGLFNKDGYSIIGTSESTDGALTPAIYRKILESLNVSEKSRAFLAAHYYAPQRQASMEELAVAVGYESFAPANSQYGRLAHAIADALPTEPQNMGGEGYGNWMQSVAYSYSELNEKGHFLWTLRPEVARALEQLGWVSPDIADEQPARSMQAAAPDIVTTREILIDARRGQGKFRNAVLQYWSGRCAVTGCSVTSVLVASHIKPWADSSDSERLDGFNGLLLTPNIDRLFDNYLITFAADGRLMVSRALDTSARDALGLAAALGIRSLHARHEPFLASHRQKFTDIENNRS